MFYSADARDKWSQSPIEETKMKLYNTLYTRKPRESNSCCLSSGAVLFCFWLEVYSLFFCKRRNSRDKDLLVAVRLGMLHLGATCKQMRPFSVECKAKDVSSGELAVPHKCNNTPAQLALTSFTGSKLCVQEGFRAKYVADIGNAHWSTIGTHLLRSLHCALFMSTLKVSEVSFLLKHIVP